MRITIIQCITPACKNEEISSAYDKELIDLFLMDNEGNGEFFGFDNSGNPDTYQTDLGDLFLTDSEDDEFFGFAKSEHCDALESPFLSVDSQSEEFLGF